MKKPPRRGPIMIPRRDKDGLVASFGVVVEPCVNEPPRREVRPDDTIDTYPKLTHGIATYVFDDGATLLCDTCGWDRREEEARQARLRRLPPIYRDWLAAQGIDDWRPR